MKILILKLNDWTLTDETTKQVKSGITCHFMNTRLEVAKLSIDSTVAAQINEHSLKLPAIFEVDQDMKATLRDGKQTFTPIFLSAKFVKQAKIFE